MENLFDKIVNYVNTQLKDDIERLEDLKHLKFFKLNTDPWLNTEQGTVILSFVLADQLLVRSYFVLNLSLPVEYLIYDDKAKFLQIGNYNTITNDINNADTDELAIRKMRWKITTAIWMCYKKFILNKETSDRPDDRHSLDGKKHGCYVTLCEDKFSTEWQ